MDGSVRIWDLTAAQELNAFTDNRGPVSAVLFLEDGQVILSVSIDDTLIVRSIRTGRLLRRLAGVKQPASTWVAENESGATMQFSLGGGARYSALAPGPDSESVLAGSAQDTTALRFLRADTPKTAPRVDAQLNDPYTHFESLYRSVGLRIAHDGPGAGDVTLA